LEKEQHGALRNRSVDRDGGGETLLPATASAEEILMFS
jgi:hypothetical protein